MELFTNLFNNLQSNPKLLIGVSLLILLIIGSNLSMLGLLRPNATEQERATKWGKVFQGRALAQKAQDAQLNELHQLVSQLPPAPPPEPPADA